MTKRHVDRSAQELQWLKIGENLAAEEARTLRAEVEACPNDSATRIKLIGYYQAKPKDAKLALPHLLWLIDNQPWSSILNHVQVQGNARTISTCFEHWMQQIELNPTDDRVLGNAAVMFLRVNRDKREQLLRRAQALSPKFIGWTRELLYMYKWEALSGAKKQRQRCATLAIEETERALALYDSLGERVGLLMEVTPVAIQFRYFEIARNWSFRLLRFGRRSESPIWQQTACIYLSQIALAENNRKMNRLWFRLLWRDQAVRCVAQ